MLDTALEAVFLLISVFQPPLAEYLVVAGAHCIQAAPKPRIEWLLGILTSLAILTSIAGPLGPSYLETTHTPYSLLGVTTTSSTAQITHAYHDLVHRTQAGIQLGTVADVSQLTAYRGAYETLTDPLRRCVYHRDNELPDWYGIPKLCWGELAIDRLRAAKGVVRARMGSDGWFEGGTFWGSKEGEASAPADGIHVPGGGFWAWLRAVLIGTWLQGMSWVKSASNVLLATAIKGWFAFTNTWQQCLDWVRSAPEALQAAVKVWLLALMGKWQQGLNWFQSALVVLITSIKVWVALVNTWEQWVAWLSLIPLSATSALVALSVMCLLAVVIYLIPNKADGIRAVKTAVTSSRLWMTLVKVVVASAERCNAVRKWLHRILLDITGAVARNAVIRMSSDIIGGVVHNTVVRIRGKWWVA